jgi:hypothetical protein
VCRQFQTVHTRHFQIDQEDVGYSALEESDRLQAIASRLDLKAQIADELGEGPTCTQ